jgi:hypothetical protein
MVQSMDRLCFYDEKIHAIPCAAPNILQGAAFFHAYTSIWSLTSLTANAEMLGSAIAHQIGP